MYEVFLHPTAAKFLVKADNVIAGRIKKKLKGLENSPESLGNHMKYTKFWKLRIGDYRAIYEILEADKKVNVLFIGHRSDVYDNFSKLF